MITDKKKLEHTSDIRVRYADTDKMGFVYNGKYLEYFEVGRSELMRSFGMPYTTFEKAGYFLPLIEAHVNFKSPAYYDDLLHVQTWFYPEIKATVEFIYNVFSNDILVATGYTIHTFLNEKTKRPTRPPSFFIESLKKMKLI